MWVFTVSYRTVCVNTTTGSELQYHLHGMSVDTIWHKHRIEIWYCPGSGSGEQTSLIYSLFGKVCINPLAFGTYCPTAPSKAQ